MSSGNTLQMKTAIVGVATQLPSGDLTRNDLDYHSFWPFLLAEGQAHRPLSPSLFSSSEFGSLQEKLDLPARGGFLKKYESLDSSAFGISTRDARVMPFTTRRLTELSFEALSDAGIDYRNQKIGSFMSGVSHFEVSRPLSTEGSFAGIPSAPANRIAYVLGITGPSVQLDTACNSSLTALHLAILAMEAGDCTAALVGAAQINREVAEWRNYCLSGVLSSDGITKPFDDGADGFGRGEGAAVVVIKPLEDALRDNDHIYSVIVGSAINSTGSLMPLSVPSGVAQKECIQTAYMRAGLRPTDADFAELHITGTSVGDPIEANAAGEIFARQEHLDVGSVKGNLGHLEVAAFLVSLLKVCLIFEKKTVPPTVNLSTPSRAIHWDRHRLHVPTAPKPLSCRLPSGRSIASISGAGIGGSTGHVVVESPPERPNGPVCVSGEFPVVVMVGGLSPRAVSQICESIRKADFSSIGDMRACATTLSRRVRQLPWRTYFTLPILPRTEILPAILVPTASPPLIFLFSGQGPQNLEMGRRLYSSFPVFRATIIELDDVYRRVVGESLIETTGLFVSPITSPSILLTQSAWPVTITVAAIAMLQMALFDLSLSVGITPSAFVGHSAGETAILYTSGAGSKAMALEIAIARGQAMTVTERDDLGMAALACGADAAEKIISQIAVTDGALEISCFNSSVSVALSGSVCHLGEAIALARSQGIFAQRIRTMVPGHSSYMDVIKDDYLARMADVFARYPGSHIPNVPVFSTCTGKKLVAKFCPAYFWDNCRKPVLFSQAISNLLASFPDPIFLEISCHPVLSSSILQHSVDERSVLCPMRRSTQDRGGDEPALFTETLAQITLLGYNACDLSGLYGPSDYKGLVIDHPWVYRTIPPPGVHFSYTNSTNGVNGSLSTNISINEYTHPRLAQHVINGEPILPATGYIEILLKAGANFLWDVEFSSFYSLSAKKSTPMILERSGYDWCLKSLNNGPSDPTAREHARGLMDRSLLMKSPESLDLDYLWGSLPKLEMEGFYESISSFASFGPAYRRVLRCHGGPSELVAHVQGPSPEESSTDCQLDPVALDACLHIMLHPAISKQSGAESMYLPATLGRFVHHGRGSTTGDWFSHIRRRAWYPDSKAYDVVITDGSGIVICEFQNFLVRRLSVLPPLISRRLDLIFQPVSLRTNVINPEATYSYRDRQNDENDLHAILDILALELIFESFEQNVVVGGDVSRQRYFDFARGALHTKTVQTSHIMDSEMRTRYPAHFEVTARIAEVHQTVFHSSKTAVDALYSDDLMARFYVENSRTSAIYPDAVGSFSLLLDSLQGGGKQAINILEVGAGTGLLTKQLVEVLRQNPDLLGYYTVTDASYALAADLARTVHYSKMTPKSYDLTKDPCHQGFHTESYDVIVALHVLHAVPDIRSCLSYLKSLLVPGGYLHVIELDGESWAEKVGSVWFDCVFGSFSEWFGFTDGRTHCTMPPVVWMEMLQDLGFVNGHASIDGGHNFFFTAQKADSFDQSALPKAVSKMDLRHVVNYSFGKEMELRTYLRDMARNDHLQLYVIALKGRDAESGMGLCATLALEFPFWSVRFAIFQCAVQLSDPSQLLSRHHDLFEQGEHAIYFPEEGSPCLLRVVPSPAPAARDAPTPPLALGDSDHLVVDIISFQSTTASICAFVGQVVTSNRPGPSPGDAVAGITAQKMANRITVHSACLVALNTEYSLPEPGDVLKSVATTLIQDCLPKRPEASNSRARFLVATEDEFMFNVFAAHFEAETTQRDFQNDDPFERVDVLITDSHTSSQYPHLRHWVPRSGRFLLWDVVIRDSLQGLTSEVEDALKRNLPGLREASNSLREPRSPASSVTPNSKPSLQLFRHDKSYILLGGIGGLGVDLAVWMYQRGARHVILTSRRGIGSLDPARDVDALSKIAYLRSRHELELQLAKCDSTDSSAMLLLVNSLSVPIGGCFQLTLVLSDHLFLNQTQDTFADPHRAKLGVFETFAAVVKIEALDFYVAFSSFSGLIGHVGQSNYASASTVLEGALAHYSNAFSLVVPGIRDAGYLDRVASAQTETKNDVISLASMSAAELWSCLEDGLRKLRDGPSFIRYIPDLNWDSLHAKYPLPPAFRYLLSSTQHSSDAKGPCLESEEEILRTVLSAMEVERQDFDFNRPLLSYGLDSLSATRLSAALHPFVQVSQVQLLAGVSWSELRGSLLQSGDADRAPEGAVVDHYTTRQIVTTMLGVDEADFDPNVPLISYGLDSISASKLAAALRPHLPHVTQLQLMGNTTWTTLVMPIAQDAALASLQPANPDNSTLVAETIVEICAGPGLPLIAFPGSTGSLAPLLALRTHFSGALWGVQVTDLTPISPFMTHAAFVTRKIREKQPLGPYRLCAFSGSAVLGVAVAKLLEEAGQGVIQLSFIDGFPLLWTYAETELCLREQNLPALLGRHIGSTIGLLRNDPLYGPESEQLLQWEAALAGTPDARETNLAMIAATRRLAHPLLQFLLDFYPSGVQRSHSAFSDALAGWVSSIEAPFSLIVAELGILSLMPHASHEEWADLGAHRCRSLKKVRHHFVSGVGHYGILAEKTTAVLLQQQY